MHQCQQKMWKLHSGNGKMEMRFCSLTMNLRSRGESGDVWKRLIRCDGRTPQFFQSFLFALLHRNRTLTPTHSGSRRNHVICRLA